MEDVLDLYAASPDPQQPVVCFDEKPVQLLADTRPPLPAPPGQVARHDYEYERCGTANLFIRFDDICARPNRLLGVYPHFMRGGDAAAS
jgi:hypothetical protein